MLNRNGQKYQFLREKTQQQQQKKQTGKSRALDAHVIVCFVCLICIIWLLKLATETEAAMNYSPGGYIQVLLRTGRKCKLRVCQRSGVDPSAFASRARARTSTGMRWEHAQVFQLFAK